MAPYLQTVFNGSGERVKVTINCKEFEVNHKDTVHVNTYMDTDVYTKIDVLLPEIQGFRLKYHNYNIAINDTLGQDRGVADYDIHTYYDKENNVHQNDIKIITDDRKDLGIYTSDGIDYYYSITATHASEGGVTVTGGVPIEGENTNVSDVKKEEEAPASIKGVRAGEGPTENKTK